MTLLFQIECFRWLLRHFGGDYFYKQTQLVLPTREFFPSIVNSDELAAQMTFEQVKQLAGLKNWPVKLQAQTPDPELKIAPTLSIKYPNSSPLGTFSVTANQEAIITYNPKILADPEQMVATFAHELAHYLTASTQEPPPGGWANWEFATDLCATFLGFGIFQANAAFKLKQYSTIDASGWQTSSGGYLSQAEHSYALALFLKLKAIPLENALSHCSTNVKGFLKQAFKELEKNHALIDELKQVKYEGLKLIMQNNKTAKTNYDLSISLSTTLVPEQTIDLHAETLDESDATYAFNPNNIPEFGITHFTPYKTN
ncbi:MAG TPA: hypothetical protein PKD81_08130 [Thiolinea sp.]|nr:hypothetical protein [Thiolinea sp.]